MLTTFANRKPVFHPLFSIVFAVVILTFGLVMGSIVQLGWFLTGLVLVFLIFGFSRTLLRVVTLILPIAVIVALLSVLIGAHWLSALTTAGRIILLGMCSVTTLTIQPGDLSRALNQVGINRKLALALLVTVRFIPVIVSEVRRIQEAMQVRNVRFRWSNPNHAYRALVMPLLVRLINIADTLSLSIETRGFSEQSLPTVYRKVRSSWKDFAFSLLLAFLIIIILLGIRP